MEEGTWVETEIPGNLGVSPLVCRLPAHRILLDRGGLVAIDKPASVKVHRNHPGETVVTLTEALQERLGTEVSLAHRLDRGTSGVVLFARGSANTAHVGRQFARRTVEKRYLALVEGVPGTSGGVLEDRLRKTGGLVVHDPELGKSARTQWQVLASGPEHALIEARPETGRTHQIRVQLARAGYPLVGDLLYGGRLGIRRRDQPVPLDLGGPLLHCLELGLTLPEGGERVRIVAALPAEFVAALEAAGITVPEGIPGIRPDRPPRAPRSGSGPADRTPRPGRVRAPAGRSARLPRRRRTAPGSPRNGNGPRRPRDPAR